MVESAAQPAGAGLSADILARVPGCARGAPPMAVVPLATGSGHSAVRVRTSVGEYVVRTRLAGHRTPDGARQERHLQNVAAAAGLAPRVLWSDARVVITSYVPGRIWRADDLADADRIERLGRRLRELHALPAPKLAPLDLIEIATRYRSAIVAADGADAARLDVRLDEIRTIVAGLASQPRPASIIHGDVHHSNIVEGGPLVLIDWEYAAVADPLFDLGSVLAYHPAARPHAARLLDAAALARNANLEMLWQACVLYEHVTELWARSAASALPYGARPGESAD